MSSIRLNRHLCACLTMLLVAACSPKPTPTEVVIGGVLPLTGDAGAFGQNASRGAELAVLQANEARLLGDRLVVWKAEDSRGSAMQAIAATRKLLDIDRATLLVGDVTSAGTHALIPIATERKVPVISPSASAPSLTNVSPFFARVWPSDVYETEVIGDYAAKAEFQRIAILYANTDYGVGMVDAFVKAFAPEKVVLRVPLERETQDFRATIKRVQLANADALFVVQYPEDAVRLLQQLAELKVVLPILATATFEDPTIANAPGAERVVFASPVSPSEADDSRKTFLATYQAKYGEAPGVLSDTGFDSAMILIKAYASVPDGDPQKIMESIRALRDYPGVSGRLSFDASGDVRKQYRLRTVVNGTFDWLPQ